VLIYSAAQLQECLISLLTYLLTYLLTVDRKYNYPLRHRATTAVKYKNKILIITLIVNKNIPQLIVLRFNTRLLIHMRCVLHTSIR